jgi:hypothetical protein
MTEETKINETKSNRIVIQNKGIGAKYERQFFIDIQNAILDGYRIAENTDRADVSMRMFKGRLGRAVLYLENTSSVIESNPEEKSLEDDVETNEEDTNSYELTLSEEIEQTDAYKALKQIAENNNLEVPSNLRNPKALKKNLLEQLQAQ